MRSVEVSAKTRKEAIDRALNDLGVELHEVEIEILDEGSRGLFGLGARDVRVRVSTETIPDRSTARDTNDTDWKGIMRGHEAQRESRHGDRPARGGRSERPERRERDRPARHERQESANRDSRPKRGERDEVGESQAVRGERETRPAREGRGARGQRDDRGGKPERGRRSERGDRTSRDTRDSATPGERREGRPPRDDARPARDRGGRRGSSERRDERPRPERRERDTAPVKTGGTADDDFDEEDLVAAEEDTRPTRTREPEDPAVREARCREAASLLKQVIDLMGIEATVTGEAIEDDALVLKVSSEDSAILIGRKGRTLSALQFMVNRMVAASEGGDLPDRIVVDVEGYLDRRRESLEDMAVHLAEKAKQTGRNMRVKPLNPQERRVIHVKLQDDPDIRTFSLGDSLYRSVIIAPKSGDEDEPNRRSRGGRGGRGGRGRGGRGREPRNGDRAAAPAPVEADSYDSPEADET